MQLNERLSLLLPAYIAFLFLAPDLSAVNYIWVGGTSANDPSVAANWTPGGGPPLAADIGEINITTNSPSLPAAGVFSPGTLSMGINGVLFSVGSGANLNLSGDGVFNDGSFSTAFTVGGGTINFTGSSNASSGAGSTTTYNLTGGTIAFSGTSVGALNSTAIFNLSNSSNLNFNASSTGNSGTGLVQINFAGGSGSQASFYNAVPFTIDSLSDTSAANSNTVNLNGTQLEFGNASNQSLSSTITGTGSLKKVGSGTVTLSGTNSYTGGTTLEAGTINISSTANLGSPSGANVLVFNPTGTLQLTGSTTFDFTGKIIAFTPSIFNGMIDTQEYTVSIPSQIGTGGVGGLRKIGTGKLTLTNTSNSYENAIISQGTLNVNADTVLGTAGNQVIFNPLVDNTATLQLGASFTFAGLGRAINLIRNGIIDTNGFTLNTGTQNGAIGSGALTILGTGVGSPVGSVVLNGTNGCTHTGGTTLGSLGGQAVTLSAPVTQSIGTAGIFTINDFSVLAPGAATTITIPDLAGTANAQITFGMNSTLATGTSSGITTTYAGTMSGAGTLTKQGSNTLVLTGTSTNTGLAGVSTKLAAGTLRISSGDNVGAGTTSSLQFTGSSTLQFDAGATYTFSNPLVIDPAITATLDTQDNSVTTPTVISGATGNLIKAGSGVLTLTGVNTYGGTTSVNAGALVVGSGGTGSIASDTTVASGGTLKGTGTITGTVTVNNGGTIRPGTSIGTLTISGPLTLNPSSNTVIELNPTTTSLINITGAVASTLDGTLTVIANSGNYAASQNYTILTTPIGMFSGTFDLIPPTGFTGSLTYTTTDVSLLITQLLLNSNNFSGNNRAIVNALNSLQFNSSYQDILAALFALPGQQQKEALESISPSRSAEAPFATMMGAYTTTTLIFGSMGSNLALRTKGTRLPDRMTSALELDQEGALVAANDDMPYGNTKRAARSGGGSQTGKNSNRCCCPPEDNVVWVQGFGDWGRQNAQGGNPKFNFTNAGALVGYEYFGFQHGLVGAVTGYYGTSLHNAHNLGSSSVDSFIIGPYGEAYFGNGYLDLGLFFSYNDIKTRRHIFFPGFDATARASHNAYQLVPHLGFGYDVSFCWGYLEPYAMFDYVADWEEGYTETGAGPLDMSIGHRYSSMLRSEVGMQAYEKFCFCWGLLLLREKAAYLNKAPFNVGRMSATIVGTPAGFTVTSFTNNQNQFTAALEVVVKGNSGWFLSGEYDGEFGAGYISNQAVGTLGYYF